MPSKLSVRLGDYRGKILDIVRQSAGRNTASIGVSQVNISISQDAGARARAHHSIDRRIRS